MATRKERETIETELQAIVNHPTDPAYEAVLQATTAIAKALVFLVNEITVLGDMVEGNGRAIDEAFQRDEEIRAGLKKLL